MNGKLYVVGTPIGNLKDITERAKETLTSVDLVLAEDTRVTSKLLNHLGIKKPMWRYDEYAKSDLYERILEFLGAGKEIALVTDAGTPLIADPGSKLIAFIRERTPEVKIVPIPGPSAIVTALSASGMNADRFTFAGYPPHKKGRQTFFKTLKQIEMRPVVIYESPHRLQKTFNDMEKICGIEHPITVAKELTKIHEEIWKGTLEEAKRHFQKEKGKGEFVIIIP
ncbi:16S rRNA (cytidine(1402)-2'-O)-methyltransferase [Patescibacteria group bacterium]|nr:16S rRNA (cytidine(1402)-2'-O)-methyltransferase [Patescibacteria group bacterium]MCL5114206.1 16S rRNA (cytidine(1402)-2'-O)-methyltransferase [Patescibacteria group bacterium]